MMDGNGISVVVSVYNEETTVTDCVLTASRFLDSLGASYEIIVVNDASADQTLKKVLELVQRGGNTRIKVLSHEQHMGVSYALKTAFSELSGDVVLFIEPDSIPSLDRLLEFIKALEYGHIVVESKWHRESKMGAPIVERFIRCFFTIVGRLLVRIEIGDITCRIRAIRREALEWLVSCPWVSPGRLTFIPELLVLARYGRFQVIELPLVDAPDSQAAHYPHQGHLRLHDYLHQVVLYCVFYDKVLHWLCCDKMKEATKKPVPLSLQEIDIIEFVSQAQQLIRAIQMRNRLAKEELSRIERTRTRLTYIT